jgi:hypothetical protein
MLLLLPLSLTSIVLAAQRIVIALGGLRPWWVWLIAVIAGPILVIVGMVLINFLLELFEYLAFAWRRCPQCRARRWSWGFTRGFGL